MSDCGSNCGSDCGSDYSSDCSSDYCGSDCGSNRVSDGGVRPQSMLQGTCAEKLRMRKVVIVSRVVSGGFLLDLHSGFTSVLLSRSINKRRNNMLRYKYLCKWPSDRFQLSIWHTTRGITAKSFVNFWTCIFRKYSHRVL